MSLQPGRIALAVPVLVVEEDVGQCLACPAQRANELGARARVPADLRELVERKRPGFAQHGASNDDLADVVMEAPETEQRDPRFLPAEAMRNRLGEGHDPRSVALCLVALLERTSDGRQHARSGFRMPSAIPPS